MSHVHESNAAQCTDEKYHVEPAVIEVKLQVAENFRYYHPTITHVQMHYNIHMINEQKVYTESQTNFTITPTRPDMLLTPEKDHSYARILLWQWCSHTSGSRCVHTHSQENT